MVRYNFFRANIVSVLIYPIYCAILMIDNFNFQILLAVALQSDKIACVLHNSHLYKLQLRKRCLIKRTKLFHLRSNYAHLHRKKAIDRY